MSSFSWMSHSSHIYYTRTNSLCVLRPRYTSFHVIFGILFPWICNHYNQFALTCFTVAFLFRFTMLQCAGWSTTCVTDNSTWWRCWGVSAFLWYPKPSSPRQCRLSPSSRTTHSASRWSSVSRKREKHKLKKGHLGHNACIKQCIVKKGADNMCFCPRWDEIPPAISGGSGGPRREQPTEAKEARLPHCFVWRLAASVLPLLQPQGTKLTF